MERERWETYLFSLEAEKPEWLVQIEQQAKQQFVPIMKRPMQTVLKFLMKTKQPKKVLEIGTAIGFSALFMSAFLPPESTITTIEKIPKRIIQAKQNIQQADRTKQIRLLEGDAKELLHELVKDETCRYDFIFMDAAKGQYLYFLEPVLQLLLPGGVFVSDNIGQDETILESRFAISKRNRTIHARMRTYLETITHMETLETLLLPIGDGISISEKKKVGK